MELEERKIRRAGIEDGRGVGKRMLELLKMEVR